MGIYPIADSLQTVAGRYKINDTKTPHELPQAESSYKKAKATLANSREWLQLNPGREVVSSAEWILGLSSPVIASNSMVVG